MKNYHVEIHFLPQIIIHSRTYRANNIRLNGRKKWAEVEYWTEERGWQEVHDSNLIEQVARMLWYRRNQ